MTVRGITVGLSWPRPTTPCDLAPRWEGEFRNFQDWVSFASKRLTVAYDSNGHPLGAICVDTLGRRCANGRDFARARDEGTFPVRYFWDCKPGIVRELLAPWADHHGPLPDYDHPAAGVFDSGVQYAVELLAKDLDVDDWTPCEGTEDYDGDLGGTLMNIVCSALPKDQHGDHMRPQELVAEVAAMRRALELLNRDARPTNWSDDEDPEQVAAWRALDEALGLTPAPPAR